jgi:sigma-B regulation protein RsbU (phosphoserine phosphatase)
MNDSMSDMNESNMFVTLFCGILNMETGQLDYCNAGHNAPLLFTDRIAPLDVVPNLPLGIMQDFVYQRQSIQLKYDDALFLFTDGVTEAENIHHELFGDERLEEVMRTRRSAQNHLEAVKAAVENFVGEAPQSDDITLLFIHYLG